MPLVAYSFSNENLLSGNEHVLERLCEMGTLAGDKIDWATVRRTLRICRALFHSPHRVRFHLGW